MEGKTPKRGDKRFLHFTAISQSTTVNTMQRRNKVNMKNYVRRGMGILLFLLPFTLIACSLRGRPFHLGKGLLPVLGVSVGLMVVALLLSSLNLYLSFLRPALLRHRPDYRFVSGIPLM